MLTLSRFVYKVSVSAKHYKEEQQELLSELQYYVIVLETFGKLFVRRNQARTIEGPEEGFCRQVDAVCSDLRLCLIDYEKLAIESDLQYRENSPWSPQAAETAIFEMPVLETLPDPPKPMNLVSRLAQPFRKASQSPLLIGESWRWSLFEKTKMNKTLSECIKHGKKLQGLMNLMICSDQYLRQPEILIELQPLDSKINPFESHFAMSRAGQATGNEARQAVASQYAGQNPQLGSPKESIPKDLPSRKRILTEVKSHGSFMNDETVLEASREHPQNNEDEIHKLAGLLLEAGRYHLRTLPLECYVKDSASQYMFFFQYPPTASDHPPCTLNDLLESSGPNKAKLHLTARFKIAMILSQAIGTFHAYGWVHKSLRSHTVRFFFDRMDACIFDQPFITDFALSRPESSETRLTYDLDPEKNLYRHPERQNSPTNKFTKVHDIYALGIVLLEIGVWESAKKMYRDACSVQKVDQLSPETTKRVFLKNVRRRLDHHMGSAYRSAVEACLSGEFQDYYGNQGFPVLFQNRVVRNVDITMLMNASDA